MTATPLSPLGAVRRRFAGDASDDFFRRLGVGAARCDLGDQGLYLAEELVSWNPWMNDDDRRAFAVFVLALLLANRQGSTRLELDPKGAGASLVNDVLRAAGLEGELDAKKVLARIKQLVGRFERVIGQRPTGDEAQPLLCEDNAVYPHRLWWLEDRLALQLAPRIGARASSAEETAAAVAAAAAAATPALTDEQERAVAAAVGFRLSVVTGGPGTGKTATLAAIVRALRHLGLRDEEIALAAPTGKAANRMTMSMAAALGSTRSSNGGGAPAAQTIHRMLGFLPGGGFRHGEANPVPAQAVILDEASMLDLALMERVCRALAPETRLVLVGDPQQLPSVEAGQVLADLLAGAAASGGQWAARLTRSFRADAGTATGAAILQAALAVQDGDARRLVGGTDRLAKIRSSPDHIAGAGVEIFDANLLNVHTFVDRWWSLRAAVVRPLARRDYHRRAGGWAPGDREALEELLSHHESARLLTVTRGGDAGARTLSARCHQHMLDELTIESQPEMVPGEPVMFTRNDYDRGLFNGDQGVIVWVVDDDGAKHWRAIFRRGGDLVPFPVDALRGGLELAWAMTVHKSQGSELDRIALVLPQEDSPLLTRELIYTALTRARSGAALIGPSNLVTAAARRTAARSSGLAKRLTPRSS
ncbi:MAG TPA: exodeoxyribonuclease V subunit alpha [Kofleriaceae bacterium]|nr:exodeoxyribonuclease V subunit alpha [Kofleriaceae bacterium]